jgi:hypothetical protein
MEPIPFGDGAGKDFGILADHLIHILPKSGRITQDAFIRVLIDGNANSWRALRVCESIGGQFGGERVSG